MLGLFSQVLPGYANVQVWFGNRWTNNQVLCQQRQSNWPSQRRCLWSRVWGRWMCGEEGREWRQGIGGWGTGMDFRAFLNKISVSTPPPASTYIYLFVIYFCFLIRSCLSISHETEPKGSTIKGSIHIQPEHKELCPWVSAFPKLSLANEAGIVGDL